MRDRLRDIPYAALNLEQTTHAPLHIMTQIQQKLASQKNLVLFPKKPFWPLKNISRNSSIVWAAAKELKTHPFLILTACFFKSLYFFMW